MAGWELIFVGRYRKIECRTWTDEKFRSLSPIPPCAQGLWFFLLTGPHTGPIPGLFRSGRSALAEDLGWPLKSFDMAFSEISEKGMAEADFQARLIWLPNAIRHNPPASPNVVKGWRSEFNLLPECHLRDRAKAFLKAFLKGLGKDGDQAFLKAFGEASSYPSSKTLPNQEQEQEQEEKKDTPARVSKISEGVYAHTREADFPFRAEVAE